MKPRHLPATPILFLLAPVAVYLILFILPTAQSFYLSLFDWSGIGPIRNFIGLGNFVQVAQDGDLLAAAGHNLYAFALLLLLTCTASLGVALLLDRRSRLKHVYRVIVFLPVVLSPVVTGFIWRIMFSPDIGIVNPLLADVGLPQLQHDWLADPNTALTVVVFTMFWQWNGLASVILLAGLQNIPLELKDAARVDGAREREVFRHITLPHLAPSLTIVSVLLAIYAFRSFDIPYVVGGPAGAPDGQTLMVATEIQLDAFGHDILSAQTHMSYAMSEGIILFVLLGAVAAALLVFMSRRERYVD